MIRRAPAGPEPVTAIVAAPNNLVVAPTPARATPGHTAIGAAAVSIISGWATAVVASDLITGWWHTDRVFCVAVGFLTVLFASTTVPGVVLLLLRKTLGRYLVVFGSGVALLTFGSVFLAGARIPSAVYLIPALPATALILALHPGSGRWCAS